MRVLQYILAVILISRGLLYVVVPESVYSLIVNSTYKSNIDIGASLFILAGSYAVLAGLIAATAVFSVFTYLFFGLTTIPLLVMNYYFYVTIPIFNDFILIDFVLNLTMLCICFWGYHRPTSGSE